MNTLIVEDDTPTRRLLAKILRSRGHDVTACPDAETAWQTFQREAFDLVVLDLVLPGMDGLELCRKIRALPDGDRNVILVLTARRKPEDLQAALQAGANDYIAKPIDSKLLDVRLIVAEKNVRDIAKRKEAEEALKESEEKFRGLAEQSPNMIFINKKGRVIYANKKCEEIMGYTREEFYSPTFDFYVLIAPENIDQIRTSFAKHMKGEMVRPLEYALITKHGERVEAILNTQLIRYEGESAILGVVTDITEWKKAEEALKVSEERFRMLFDSASDAIFIHDLEGHFLEVNKVACERLGYSREELLQMTPMEIDSPEYAALVPKRIQDLRQRGHLFMETAHRRRDGEVIPIELNSKIIDLAGRAAILSIARDITERKRAEKLQASIYRISEAVHSVETMDELFQSIHQIIAELMPARNFYIALYDRQADKLAFPYFVDQRDEKPARKKPGKGITEYILRTGKPQLVSPELFEELRRKGEVEPMGTPAVDWLGVPLRTGGRTIGVLAVQTYSENVRYSQEHKDVLMFVSAQVAMAIERKRAQEALKSSEENFRNLFRLTSDAILIQDKDRRIIDLNKSAEQMFGYKKEELLGHPETRLADYDKTDRAMAEERVRKALKGEVQRFEWWGKRKNGTSFPEEVVLNKTVYDGEEVVFVTIRDITERKRTEEALAKYRNHLQALVEERTRELQASQEELVRSERLAILGKLSSSIAHEIRNPLGVIDSSVYYLKMRLENADKKSLLHLDRISRQIKISTAIIQNLQDLTRMKEPHKVQIDISNSVRNGIGNSKVPRTVRVVKKVPEGKFFVNADEGQLSMVFKNIVTNAVQAMDNRGTLWITAERANDGAIQVSIRDSGPGILPEKLEKIFQPFFSTKAEGFGFGLTICQMIVERHGGTIEAQSEGRKGATFIVRFPCVEHKP